MISIKDELYYSINEVAELFAVTKFCVWKWIREGKISTIRYSFRKQFVARSEIERFTKQYKLDVDLEKVVL
ncbi:helix-turn-helix domain-containing protein [Methanosphaerula subterraneus]|uniref:helix-turn-helix domain-containing protein n=1 Tax=Methanosphaerula subterraneus TaxID=3350244 RepID=UPI003F86ED6A